MTPSDLAGRFPADFTFGVATAAYQIEGAAWEDGRGACIWDAFANMPGRVFQMHNGDTACDHYHRWEADLDLMADLGVDAYRFSIAWPRLLPQGRGTVNEAGLAFYDRLLDGLAARGIRAFATLYHWDLPLALTARGGWTDRDTADAFADYASLVARRLGDRIETVATFNEPWCSVYLGHWLGKHAPGERSIEAAMAALHITNLAHGKGVLAVRAERPDMAMGIVINAQSTYAASQRDEDRAAAERHHRFHNGVFFDPIFKGAYPDDVTAVFGDMLKVESGDLATIAQPLDWWGFNYYFPTTVAARNVAAEPLRDEDAATLYLAQREVASTDSDVRTDIGWEIKPEGIADFLRAAYERYDLPPCHITENGACYNTEPSANGHVDDEPRRAYIAAHLARLADAIGEGIPVRGYFAWSLMDNFEWAEGYSMRFGLVHVDYGTQARTVKASGEWYRDLLAAHAARQDAS